MIKIVKFVEKLCGGEREAIGAWAEKMGSACVVQVEVADKVGAR